MRILLTRPRLDAVDTARALEARGHQVLIEPVLDIVLEAPEGLDLQDVQALLATSRNGVRALAAATSRRDLPLMAVGRSTAALARECGFPDVRDADGDVDDLTRLAVAELDPAAGPLLHAAGAETAGDLKGTLAESGFQVRREVLYRAVANDRISADAAAALTARRIDAVLFFSPRSAEAFARVLDNMGLTSAAESLVAFCISPRAAEMARRLPYREVVSAPRPNQDALLSCVDGHAASERHR
ncbi:MAG: hypothetical protein TEF_10080 [Rhizobiales bacterium NRL2]|nr:MAG: hypothetical protein TEF_10080 [Rhizobiales bacterium NRL2]